MGNDDGGPTFVFSVTGDFSRSDLESGFVQVQGGETYPLYCQRTGESTVLCHTTLKVSGAHVVIGFAGSTFWNKVPDRRSSAPAYCYHVYDWAYYPESKGSTDWAFIGSHCQDSAAQFGDFIYDFYSPDFDEYYDFEYLPGDFCGFADPGEGYYYPFCPDDD
ncbi:hypothetical protein MASR2M66_07390 [Chloroflexota bacterium]